MPVTMICPNLKCGRTVAAAESARGKVVRCAHCQTLFIVPKESRPMRELTPSEPQPTDAKDRGQP